MNVENLQRFAKEYLSWFALAIFGFIVTITSFIFGLINLFRGNFWMFCALILATYISNRIMKWAGKSAIQVLKDYDAQQ